MDLGWNMILDDFGLFFCCHDDDFFFDFDLERSCGFQHRRSDELVHMLFLYILAFYVHP
jgi:hypothetical protein